MKLFLTFIFFFLSNALNAQTFTIKGVVLDMKEPIMGARIFVNNKFSGNSDSNGAFEITTKLGDSLKVLNPFYEDFAIVVKDSLKQNIELKIKQFQLKEVNISFNKNKTIDSVLMLAFSKLDTNESSKKIFLRQTVVKSNLKTILANEGVLNVKWPSNKKLSIFSGGYKQVGIGISSTCQIFESKTVINYASNPQIKIRRGLAPIFFYKEIRENSNRISINYDSTNTIINIYGELKQFKLKIKYVYTIKSQTNELVNIQYYEEKLADKDFFFLDFNYSNKELKSIYSNARQIRRGISYSTNDELFLGEKISDHNFPINFNANKCGLNLYLKETAGCDVILKYKQVNNIPEQKYF